MLLSDARPEPLRPGFFFVPFLRVQRAGYDLRGEHGMFAAVLGRRAALPHSQFLSGGIHEH